MVQRLSPLHIDPINEIELIQPCGISTIAILPSPIPIGFLLLDYAVARLLNLNSFRKCIYLRLGQLHVVRQVFCFRKDLHFLNSILKLSQPNPDDLGYVDLVAVVEICGVRLTVVQNEEGGNSVSTVILLASTDSILDDLERAVDYGLNTYKAMCKDSRIVPGAAATEIEIELARRVKEFSFKETGLDWYAIAKFAESFEMIPTTLAENAGLNAMEIISSLYAEHANGNAKVGIDLEEGVSKDASVMKVWDLYITKFFALKYAADAACTVLRVDQITTAKPAGGPRR
ncbi:T-complex protein 1 subunit theta-like [Syzygium oleosum]|uniref:T-complex protein 1 subunit theta-like n=1 Tax=Syzygium oleosum TaxID=219896 RepID=UPI0024BAB6FD|nr:T-complex protein 1 subunit theta-like [Syzygium oleosum]